MAHFHLKIDQGKAPRCERCLIENPFTIILHLQQLKVQDLLGRGVQDGVTESDREPPSGTKRCQKWMGWQSCKGLNGRSQG